MKETKSFSGSAHPGTRVISRTPLVQPTCLCTARMESSGHCLRKLFSLKSKMPNGHLGESLEAPHFSGVGERQRGCKFSSFGQGNLARLRCMYIKTTRAVNHACESAHPTPCDPETTPFLKRQKSGAEPPLLPFLSTPVSGALGPAALHCYQCEVKSAYLSL
jgi:hypothetical protein